MPQTAKYPVDMRTVYDHMYGERHGVSRLLDILEERRVKASFAVSGQRLRDSADLVREVARRGHDLASQNWVHEYPVIYEEEEERTSLGDTAGEFQSLLGRRPTGYLSPGHRPTPGTLRHLMDLGYRWDADFMHADSPLIVDDGKRQIVGMTSAKISDYHTYSNGGRTPRSLHAMLTDGLRAACREGGRGSAPMIGYAVHPHLCHGFRTEMLYDLLGEISEMTGVWVATGTEVADWVLQNRSEFPTVSLTEVERDFPKMAV